MIVAPTVAELLCLTTADFLADLTDTCDIAKLCLRTVQLAYDDWCGDQGMTNALDIRDALPAAILGETLTALTERAWVELEQRAEDAQQTSTALWPDLAHFWQNWGKSA